MMLRKILIPIGAFFTIIAALAGVLIFTAILLVMFAEPDRGKSRYGKRSNEGIRISFLVWHVPALIRPAIEH